MALDPRLQVIVDHAQAAVDAAERTLSTIQSLVASGMRRVTWRQPYTQQDADQQVFRRLNDARSKLESEISRLEISEQALAKRLMEDNPFVCPSHLEHTLNALESLNASCRPGKSGHLLSVLSDLHDLGGDRDQLCRILKNMTDVESRGVDACASQLASRYGHFNSPAWRERYEAVITKYNSTWADVARGISRLVSQCQTKKETLRALYVRRLLAVLTQPLDAEIASVKACLQQVLRLEADARLYITSEQVADAFIEKAIGRLYSTTTGIEELTNLPPATLDQNDIDLAQQWANSFGDRDYWRSAMVSARRAERSLLRSYAALYGVAFDLAVEQLAKEGDPRWQVADIEAGGLLIDVKNARRSFSSADSYSEHCVPRFKQDRNYKDVIISGVLSPYSKIEQAAATSHETLLWLGEVSIQDIARLSQEFDSELLETDLRVDSKGSFVPPWLFEYPPEVYLQRTAAVAALRSMPVRFPRRELHIASGILLDALSGGIGQSNEEREAMRLAKRLHRVGLSRPVVFLHILETFCSSHIGRGPFPGQIFKAILFPASNRREPLAMFDPLETIASLLDTLEQAHPALERFRFSRFRLTAPGILRGCGIDGRWQTIIAYCGGWKMLKSGGKVRCGKNPIVIGVDNPCHVCGYLVCRECGWCKQGCARVDSQTR